MLTAEHDTHMTFGVFGREDERETKEITFAMDELGVKRPLTTQRTMDSGHEETGAQHLTPLGRTGCICIWKINLCMYASRVDPTGRPLDTLQPVVRHQRLLRRPQYANRVKLSAWKLVIVSQASLIALTGRRDLFDARNDAVDDKREKSLLNSFEYLCRSNAQKVQKISSKPQWSKYNWQIVHCYAHNRPMTPTEQIGNTLPFAFNVIMMRSSRARQCQSDSAMLFGEHIQCRSVKCTQILCLTKAKVFLFHYACMHRVSSAEGCVRAFGWTAATSTNK